jgi:hypothetical protein
MWSNQLESIVVADPEGVLERAFIADYLRTHPVDDGNYQTQKGAAVMREAAIYASGRLAEIEARAHFIHEIHGADESRGTRP